MFGFFSCLPQLHGSLIHKIYQGMVERECINSVSACDFSHTVQSETDLFISEKKIGFCKLKTIVFFLFILY